MVNLFVVGAMKAGTTSLIDIFQKHPEIYTPPIKEPHYFVKVLPKSLYDPSRFFSLNDYFESKFPESVHIAHIKNSQQYEKLYSLSNNHKYLIDASTAYLHAPDAAVSICKYNTQSKIIILRRNPLKRAISHYKMDLGLGRTKRSFESIIKEQIKSYEKKQLSWDTYLNMSFYDTSILEFKKLFKDVLVIDFEDFTANNISFLKKISDFLDISEFEDFSLIHKNKTRSVRFQAAIYYLKKSGVKDVFSKVFNQKLRHFVFRMLSKDESKPLALSEDTKRQLLDIFKIESNL